MRNTEKLVAEQPYATFVWVAAGVTSPAPFFLPAPTDAVPSRYRICEELANWLSPFADKSACWGLVRFVAIGSPPVA